MAAKTNPDLQLAEALVSPYCSGKQAKVLSFRCQPEGGLVVVTADGRKLWFSAEEAARMADEMQLTLLQNERKEAAAVKRVPVKLAPAREEGIKINDGRPVVMVVHENQMKQT